MIETKGEGGFAGLGVEILQSRHVGLELLEQPIGELRQLRRDVTDGVLDDGCGLAGGLCHTELRRQHPMCLDGGAPDRQSGLSQARFGALCAAGSTWARALKFAEFPRALAGTACRPRV
jgi:hypothetical protein